MTLIQATPKSRAKGLSCSWCLVPGGRAGVWGAAGPLNRGHVIGARFRQGWARGRNAGPSSCWVSRAPGLCTCPPPPTPSCPSVHRGKCRYLPGIEPLPRPSQAHPASHLKMVPFNPDLPTRGCSRGLRSVLEEGGAGIWVCTTSGASVVRFVVKIGGFTPQLLTS